MKLGVVLTKFDDHCELRKYTKIVRHQFLTEDWEFAELKLSLVRDVIICSVSGDHIRGRFLTDAGPLQQ